MYMFFGVHEYGSKKYYPGVARFFEMIKNDMHCLKAMLDLQAKEFSGSVHVVKGTCTHIPGDPRKNFPTGPTWLPDLQRSPVHLKPEGHHLSGLSGNQCFTGQSFPHCYVTSVCFCHCRPPPPPFSLQACFPVLYSSTELM